MNFLLTGVETNNKGAELMLYAILQEIERKFPDSTIYIERNKVKQGKEYIKSSLEFILLDSPYNKLIKYLHINGILHRMNIRSIYFYPNLPQIDYLLDGSGLLFTDQMVKGKHIVYWKKIFSKTNKYNTKKIFLPQGFGPLEKETTKDAIKLLFKNADIIYARENVSYNFLCSVNGIDKSKLKICTDFTSLVEGFIPEQYAHLAGAVCIIPNMQMVNKKVCTLEEYITYLKNIIATVESKGRKVYLLNHQGKEDGRLLYICKERLGNNVETISGLNALDTKGLISTAYMVITSRFHGLASALNSCVPSLATSWSHKYQCLFEDYGLHDCILSMKNVEGDINKINKILDPNTNTEIRKELRTRIPQIKKQAEEMWDTIWAL